MEPGQTPGQLCVGRGDFDGNGLSDYAVLLVPHPKSTSAHLVLFLRKGSGYRHKTLTRSGSAGESTLAVAAAGTRDYDYTNKRDIVYRLATVQMYQGMGGWAFIYNRGRFGHIVCSD